MLPVPFKIYADFECILKGVKNSNKNNGSYTEKYHNIPYKFTYKVKKVVLYRGKNAAYRFIKAILSMILVKKMIKKHFNKILIMSAEEEEKFQLTYSC